MYKANRPFLCFLLAFVGMSASLTEINACWRKNRCQEAPVQEHYVTTEAAVLATVVSGFVYDTDGALLISPKTGAPATITVKSSSGTTIGGPVFSSSATGAYTVTVTGTPDSDNILKVIFRQNNGTESVTIIVSHSQANHKIHAVVPR